MVAFNMITLFSGASVASYTTEAPLAAPPVPRMLDGSPDQTTVDNGSLGRKLFLGGLFGGNSSFNSNNGSRGYSAPQQSSSYNRYPSGSNRAQSSSYNRYPSGSNRAQPTTVTPRAPATKSFADLQREEKIKADAIVSAFHANGGNLEYDACDDTNPFKQQGCGQRKEKGDCDLNPGDMCFYCYGVCSGLPP